jgi:hypothetical protein
MLFATPDMARALFNPVQNGMLGTGIKKECWELESRRNVGNWNQEGMLGSGTKTENWELELRLNIGNWN